MVAHESDMSNNVHPEITLAEMGFTPTKVENWHRIAQPEKENLLELLENMIKNYIKTNVQITIGSTKFNCHMMVLQCYSEFFKDLDNEQSVILPENKVTPQAFKMVYEWMLSRKPTVQREGILELFNAAHFLKIKRLVNQCWKCIDDYEIFCEDTAFILYSEARQYGEALNGNDLIQQIMLSRICKFFLTLVASKDFLELGPEEICALLNSNSIGVNTEIDVLMSAVRWLNHNWEERKLHLTKVISCVRFGLMAPWQLVALRRNTDSVEVSNIVNDSEVQKMLDDGLSYATTSYYYARNPENALNFIETLNIPEPKEREWIKDDLWEKQFSPSYYTFTTFLEYLKKIRKFGKAYWKTLLLADQNPQMVYLKSNVQNSDLSENTTHEKFRENSESSSVGEVNAAVTFIQSEEESIKNGTIPEPSSKYTSEDSEDKLHYISNLTLMLPKDNNAHNNVRTEITLAEMGFTSTEVENWDRITQPQKENLLELLLNMIKNYIKTNVQISIGSTKFNCHMMVLQCYSEFFKELDNEQSVILPENKVTPQAFNMVYEWMLSRKPTVQREGILELFNAAQFLKIKRLVDQCWICIDNDEIFSEDTAFILYSEARQYGEALNGNNLIQQLMLSRICKFFLTLVASKDFLELGPEEIFALLNSNSIGVNTEIDVLMSAVRWLNHNWEERKLHLTKVISCVRFGLMAPWQLVALRRNTDSVEVSNIVNDSAVQKMLDDGLSYATTSYYYARNPENALNFIETLNIPEPKEREWIKDDLWEKQFSPSYYTFTTFLEYLKKIREFGKTYWKSLLLADQNPQMVYLKSNVQNSDLSENTTQ